MKPDSEVEEVAQKIADVLLAILCFPIYLPAWIWVAVKRWRKREQ